ncbi:uncharacterized protein [Ptychodera flava]|uniref:uncharacterized protein n=1 Tax=Ptychodera flava TaxID=63121 RepID=UPI00396A219B
METRRNSMVRYQTYMLMFMSLCPVHANYQGGNIAIRKNVTGTPVKQQPPLHGALVDGDVQTCIKTQVEINPNITIDLLDDYKVRSISLIYPKIGYLVAYGNINVTLNKEEQTEHCEEKLPKKSAQNNTWNHTFQCGDHEGQRITVVKLSSGDENYRRGFELCEFQVFGVGSSGNIAIRKNVTGTPVKQQPPLHGALVDGDVQTCIKTQVEINPNITIDLLDDYKVRSISLIYPKIGYLVNYDGMNVTLNKEEQTEVCSELSTTSAPSNTWNLTFQCGDHEGQPITVVKLSSERGFELCEFQVFGESSSPSGTSTPFHPKEDESSITSPTASYTTSQAQFTTDNSHTTTVSFSTSLAQSTTLLAKSTTDNSHTTTVSLSTSLAQSTTDNSHTTTDSSSTSVAQSTTDNSHATTDSSSTSLAQSTTDNSHTTSVNSLPRADDSCILNATRSRRGTLLRLNYGSRVLFVCPKGTQIVDSSISICDHGNRMIPHRRCADIDECENDQHSCNFNFKCHNTIGSYLCLCGDGYREEGGLCVPERTLSERDGTENKIDVGSNYCLESEDGLWERTPSNHFSSWIPCSSDRAGVMRRFCNVKGEWNDPDTTECKTRELLDLAKKVTKIRDISDAVAIIETVAQYWNSHRIISAGDVVLISEILAKLAQIVASFKESNLNDTEMYIKLFSGEVCRLLTKDREPVWKEIHERLALDKGVVTLFNAVDSIGTAIYDFMIRSGQEVASSCSVLDIKGIFFKEDEIMVVGPSKRNEATRQRRLVQRNSTATRNNYVYFSKNTLDKLREASLEDKPLAVVSYIYNNPGDIIPADAQSTRSQGQEWVTSITTVNRIKKVNTPVISVSVFPKPEDITNLDIQMRFCLKEEGYSPVCSFVKLEPEHGMWSTIGCKVTNSGKLDTLDYVECACGHLGSLAVITTMGKSPKPFLEAAAVPILTLCCSLSLFFIVISLFAVFMARLTSDFYVVLAQAILSFSFFPILVAMEALLENQEYEKSNRLVMAFSHTALLSNSSWMMNLSVQFFIRLKYYLYRSTPCKNFVRLLWLGDTLYSPCLSDLDVTY